MPRDLSAVLAFVVLLAGVGDTFAARSTPPTLQPLETGGGPARATAAYAPAFAVPLDTIVLLDATFDGVGGTPDPQGWTSADLTTQAFAYFHVDNFLFLADYSPITGTKSVWCGARECGDEEVCSYATLPGYGNNWHQRFQSVAFNVTGDVTFGCNLRYDIEPGYDAAYLEYAAGNGIWNTLATWDGINDLPFQTIVPAASHDGTIRFRFRFKSDPVYSDEDGFHPTNGAIILDDILVSDQTGTVDQQDFEAVAPGSLTSPDGDWQASAMPGYGDYAALFDGNAVVQQDPNGANSTNLWGFFNGSTETYACGGYPGQAAVPFGKTVEGFEVYISNEIRSPVISLAGLPTNSAFLLAFDVYEDLPQDNVVYYQYRVRARVGGVWRWRTDNIVYYGGEKEWYRFMRTINDLIPAGATDIQIGIGVRDMCETWCGILGSGACHSHAPLIDNVSVTAIPDAIGVTNVNGSGPGSFYQAGIDANATPGVSLIYFAIPGAGPFTVPTYGTVFSEPVVIDGFSQPRSDPNTNPIDQPCNADVKIQLVGGVHFGGDNSLLRGVSIESVTLAANDGEVQGCFVGLAPDGVTPLWASNDGITISGLDNIVGGKTPQSRNVIAGHNNAAILIGGIGNVIEGNFIGTDVSGVTPVISYVGVSITGSTNLVGGTDPQSRNVIGGIVLAGIAVVGNPASINQVRGNYIGVDRTGTAAIPTNPLYVLAGIALDDGDGATIGGATAGARNVIAGTRVGLYIGAGSGSNNIFGNCFGSDASGTATLGLDIGVQVLASPAQKNQIGGLALGTGNLFRGISGNAVQIENGIGTRVSNNSMVSIGGLGIDLFPAGITPNDAGDGDTGANNLQNHPDLTEVYVTGSSTTIIGTLSSTPGKEFRVEFFSSSACGGSGYGPGETFIGSTNVAADGAGIAPIAVMFAVPTPPGHVVTATATNGGDETSEFSACVIALNTPSGGNVIVQPADETTGAFPVTLQFSQITSPGITTLTTGPAGPPLPGSYSLGDGVYYNLTTTATYTGSIEVCIHYDEGSLMVPESTLRMAHWNGSSWDDVTISLDTGADILCGLTTSLSPFVIGGGSVTGVGGTAVPRTLALHQNIPNPFNPTTTIMYDVPPGGSDVTIRIYDAGGRLVRTLVSDHRAEGTHGAVWDGRNDAGTPVSSGVYFYRMVAGSFSEARRMVLLK